LGAATAGGRDAMPVTSERVLHLSEEEYRRAQQEGIVVSAVLPAGMLGAREVNATVLDRRSGRTGSAGYFVEVPAVTGSGCALSGVGLEGEKGGRGSLAVRQFAAGEKLTFTYFVYNPTLDWQGRGSADTQVRLMAGGREVLSGAITPLKFEPAVDTARRQVKGRIALDPEMAPGRYILVVTVMDTAAKEPRAVSQFMDFEVVAKR
jgi:hypothetical protein